MTDLAGKFTSFEEQVATQHTEVMTALNTIAYALGAPPTTPTTTLEDLYTQLSALINGIALIYSSNEAFYASLLGIVGQINTNTDLMITNNSLNAQRLLSAILSTACACPTTVPFLDPPLDVTPTDLVDEAKCRRIQFYLSIFGATVDGIANYGGAGAMVTAAAITEIMYAAALSGGLIGAEVGVVAGPPGIALGAIVGIIGAAIGALGSSYLFTLSAQWHTAPLYDQLLASLYAANSADEGSEAFYAVINASAVLNAPFKPLLNALWWNDWSNEVYGAIPVVDDSAFDGTICVPDLGEITTCTTFQSHTYNYPGFGIFHVVTSSPVYPGNEIFTAGAFGGYSVRLITYGGGTPIRCDYYEAGGGYNGGALLSAINEVFFYPAGVIAIGCHTDQVAGGNPFSIELCPPA